MKTLLFILFPVLNLYALQIHSITVAPAAMSGLRIGLNTEAEELYYFQCWRYSVSQASILVEACFVPGFGSQISPLNNNLEIPLSEDLPATYTLTVRIYYTDLKTFYHLPDLQDERSGQVTFPLAGIMVLENNGFEKQEHDVVFPNPTDGVLYICGRKIEKAYIVDATGRKIKEILAVHPWIDLSDLARGIYYIEIHSGRHPPTVKILVKK